VYGCTQRTRLNLALWIQFEQVC